MSKKIENEIEAWANSKKPIDKQAETAATKGDEPVKDGIKLTDDIIDAWAKQKQSSSNK